MTTAAGATIDFAYDALKRLSGTTVKNSGGTTVLTHAYAYKNLGTTNGITQTTAQVEFHNVRNAMGVVISGAKYAYDALGNITEISKSEGSYYPLVKYEYDSQNQLTKETFYDGSGSADSNITATYEYTYDTAGNIHTVSKDGTVTQSYSYSTGDWKDLLVSVNGTSLTYDGAGNPTSYPRLRDQGSYHMQWDNGRQLTYLDYASSASSETQIRFAYDADGIRTSKTITKGTTETVHNYVTQNGKVVRETIGTGSTAKVLDFIYDESGKPFALKYSANGGSSFTTYYYVLNLQGDVVAIMNTNQSIAAKYSYTAWGDVLAVTYNNGSAITGKTHIGNLNPIRYRGYYYDTETGFYYLQSRYYDPMMRRFINADSYQSTGQGILGTNMFAYCNNAPVTHCDPTGSFAIIGTIIAVGAIVGGALGGVSAATTGGNVIEGAVEGALTGAVGSACGILIPNPAVSVTSSIIGAATIDFAMQGVVQYVRDGTIDFRRIDYVRMLKVGLQTGMGTAVPAFGEGAKNLVDAFGTALIWAEVSALIVCVDIIATNIVRSMSSSLSKKAANQCYLTVFKREALCK